MKNKMFINLLPIETERLIIRPTSIEDIDMILKMDKQEDTQKHLGGIKNKTKEERIVFLEKKALKFKFNLVGSLTVVLKKDRTPIGFTDFNIDENNNNAEITYIYDLDYTNRGYCSEASKKLLEIGFEKLELKKIYADTIEGNIASIRILEKLGMKHEGTRRKQAYIKDNNQYHDFLNYGILIEEWRQLYV